MKKIICLMMIVVTLLSIVMSSALADQKLTGGTSQTKTFTVKATKNMASFKLSSSKGTADVFHRSWYGKYIGINREISHGFYQVKYRGLTGTQNKTSFIWAPSATTNKRAIFTSTVITIILPVKGTYTVTIRPLDWQEASDYWWSDTLKEWIKPATWTLKKMSGCVVTSR